MLYYFSDQHVRRRHLSFLGADVNINWELFAPVESTNYWVRVQGPLDTYSPLTNMLVVTVFTPHQILYKREIAIKGFPREEYVHFFDGAHYVLYKSDDDAFIYNVFENTLKNVERPK